MVVFYFSRRSATKRLESISYAWNRERLTLYGMALVEGESESFGVECIAYGLKTKIKYGYEVLKSRICGS